MNDGLRKAFTRAGVKIALAVIVMFPLLVVVDRIRGQLGEGLGLLALLVAVVIGLVVVETNAAIIIAYLNNNNEQQ